MTVSNLSQTARVEMWAMDLVDALEANYNGRYPDSNSPVKFETKVGKKYIKIFNLQWQDACDYYNRKEGYRQGSVTAFVDKETGQVYKPASWRAPAKHVRFDMRIIRDREFLHNPENTDWAGGHLYMR